MLWLKGQLLLLFSDMIEVEKVIAFSKRQNWASCMEGEVPLKHHRYISTIITGSINGAPGDLSSLLFSTPWLKHHDVHNEPDRTALSLSFTASFVDLSAVVRQTNVASIWLLWLFIFWQNSRSALKYKTLMKTINIQASAHHLLHICKPSIEKDSSHQVMHERFHQPHFQ